LKIVLGLISLGQLRDGTWQHGRSLAGKAIVINFQFMLLLHVWVKRGLSAV
jgi:hypothetical protein